MMFCFPSEKAYTCWGSIRSLSCQIIPPPSIPQVMTLKLLLSLRGSVMTKQHRSFLHFPPSYLPNMPSYLLQCSSPFCNLPLSLRLTTHDCSVRPAHWPKFDSGMNFAGITQIPVPSSTHHHKRRKSKPLCSSIYSVLTD